MIKYLDIKEIISQWIVYILSIIYVLSVSGICELSLDDSFAFIFKSELFYQNAHLERIDVTSLSLTVLFYLFFIKEIVNKISEEKRYHSLCMHRFSNKNDYSRLVIKRYIHTVGLDYILVFAGCMLMYVLVSFVVPYKLILGDFNRLISYLIKLYFFLASCFLLINYFDVLGKSYLIYPSVVFSICLLLLLDILTGSKLIVYGNLASNLLLALGYFLISLSIIIYQNYIFSRKDIL